MRVFVDVTKDGFSVYRDDDNYHYVEINLMGQLGFRSEDLLEIDKKGKSCSDALIKVKSNNMLLAMKDRLEEKGIKTFVKAGKEALKIIQNEMKKEKNK